MGIFENSNPCPFNLSARKASQFASSWSARALFGKLQSFRVDNSLDRFARHGKPFDPKLWHMCSLFVTLI